VTISSSNFTLAGTATFNLTSSNTIPVNGGAVTYEMVVSFSTSAILGSYPFNVSNIMGNNGQPVGFSPSSVTGATIIIASATSTPTSTLIPTSTATLTATSTVKPSSTQVIFPNPATGTEPVTLAVTTSQASDSLTVQVFTVAFREVQSNVFSTSSPGVTASVGGGTTAKTWRVPLVLNDKWGTPMSSGLYYVVVSNHNGYRSVSKLLLLR
jgi:hypothetical protein